MKTSQLIVFLLLFTGTVSMAQTKSLITPDQRLYDIYEKDFVDNLVEKNLNLLVYYNLFLTESFDVIELPADKQESLKLYTSLEVAVDAKLTDLNVLNYNLELKDDEESFYRWGNSNTILRFKSGRDFNELYNEARRTYGLISQNN